MTLNDIFKTLRIHYGLEKDDLINWEDFGDVEFSLELVTYGSDVMRVREHRDKEHLHATTFVGKDDTVCISYNPDGHPH